VSYIEDYVRNVEERTLPLLRSRLADLESGRMKLGESREIGVWVDTTPEDIRRLKEIIEEYEDIIAKMKAGETP
jgi:hypothetical protein